MQRALPTKPRPRQRAWARMEEAVLAGVGMGDEGGTGPRGRWRPDGVQCTGRPRAWVQPLPGMRGLAALVGGRAPAA